MNDKIPIDIFWISGSPYSWRVLLALALKQIPFQSHLLSVEKREHRSADFLKVNPRGKVPTLRHGKLEMGESVAIVRYLDRCFPTPQLFGANEVEEAKINQQIDEIENYILPNSHSITRAVFGDTITGSEEILNAQAERVGVELAGMEDRIDSWLVGNTISAADIVLYPLIAGLLRAANKPSANTLDLRLLPFGEKYPKLFDWCNHIEELPGYDSTYPPHWRET